MSVEKVFEVSCILFCVIYLIYKRRQSPQFFCSAIFSIVKQVVLTISSVSSIFIENKQIKTPYVPAVPLKRTGTYRAIIFAEHLIS